MIVQSGPKPWPRGNDTTHPPRQSLFNAYNATRPDEMHVPMAAPVVPNLGIGPSPRMSTTFNRMFSMVVAIPSTIGVRASPAERSAPPSMKNTSMPLLNMNMIRRNGSASALTFGAAFTRSSKCGDSTYPIGAMTRSEIPMAVRNAWYTVRSTFSSSPAPANRATSTLIPVNSDVMNDDDDDEDLPRHADRGVAGESDDVADHHVVDDSLEPADDVGQHRRPRDLPNRRGQVSFDDGPVIPAVGRRRRNG